MGNLAIERGASGTIIKALNLSPFVDTIYATGAKVNGSTIDNSAVAEMASTFGHVVFPPGATKLSTITISVPAFFLPGAYVTGASGQTITFTRRVQSPEQWILRGDATYSFAHDDDGGEDAREVHISWFGAFPYPGTSETDHGAIINRAAAAMGNSRESIIHFSMGNYTIASPVELTRGCCISGSRQRRTVFRSATDGFTAFTSIGNLVRIEACQFESRTETPRESPWVDIRHTDCEIYDVDAGDTKLSFVTSGSNTRISNVRAIFGADMGAGSSLIEVRGGAQHVIERVLIGTSSTYGPETIVRVGGANQSAAISGIGISSITAIAPSQMVMVDADGGNISRCTINDVRYNGYDGTNPDNCITFRTSGTNNLSDILVDGVIDSRSTNGIRFEQNSSGIMQDIIVDSATITGSVGRGMEFVRTAGTLREIRIGNGVDVSERATPFYYEGTTSKILIAPLAQPNALPAMCYDLNNIEDDGVAQVDLHREIYCAIVRIVTNKKEFGTFICRVANDTRWLEAIGATSLIQMSTATLTGTTGTDGKITISAAEGKLMVENRSGEQQRVQLILETGIQ